MKSAVSEAVRSARIEEQQRLSPVERVRLALRLGDTALALYMRANGLTRAEAMHRLEVNKHKGRRPSCSSPKPR